MSFYFSIAFSTSDALDLDTSGSAVCMSVCLPKITNPIFDEKLREMFPPSSPNTVAVCNQITLLILYYISYRLVTLLKITDAPIQVSDIFQLSVNFKFNKCSFQILHLFIPEMSTSFTSYFVKLSRLLCFGSCNQCILACFL